MSSIVSKTEQFFSRPRSDLYSNDDSASTSSVDHALRNSTGAGTLYVLIKCDGGNYAIESRLINSIVETPIIHSIPGSHLNQGLAGLLNFRGRVLAAIKLSTIISSKSTPSTKALIMPYKQSYIALLVDSSLGASKVDPSHVFEITNSELLTGNVELNVGAVSIIGPVKLFERISGLLW